MKRVINGGEPCQISYTIKKTTPGGLFSTAKETEEQKTTTSDNLKKRTNKLF